MVPYTGGSTTKTKGRGDGDPHRYTDSNPVTLYPTALHTLKS